MFSSSKRAIASLGPIRWNAIPPLHPAQVTTTTRTLRSSPPHEAEEVEFSGNDNDFILSILRAKPSIRDTKAYLGYFNPKKDVSPLASVSLDKSSNDSAINATANPDIALAPQTNPIIQELINPIHRRTALVKLQGPFSDRQLESIARGMVYLEKLGLVSVIVVENDDWEPGSESEREAAVEDAMRTVAALEAQGARARPLLDTVVKLGPDPNDQETATDRRAWIPEAHALPEDLVCLQSALRAGEIPVLPSLALDSFCRSVRVSANDVIAALTRAMVIAGQNGSSTSQQVDMTPLRLMIINREGGVPSYARGGLPHLLVNLASEYEHIYDTFLPQWRTSHPTALSNLMLAHTCLSYMPRASSAVMVSHRSPSSLIANLVTNKPAQSSSLPHALLSGSRKLTQHTPTLFRHGLPIRVIRKKEDLDKEKLTALLEESFNKKLDSDAFWDRVDRTLDFAIVAGDYDGAAIVTRETLPSSNEDGTPKTMAYLDKFAVLPSHQGDGTVDFLWVALHDESYGLGTAFARNFIEGSMQGFGRGQDLVWRSRADNPINKWYYERSSGHLRMGNWVLFWCDAEDRLKAVENAIKATADVADMVRIKGVVVTQGPNYVVEEEQGRLGNWADVVEKIPSSWKKNPT